MTDRRWVLCLLVLGCVSDAGGPSSEPRPAYAIGYSPRDTVELIGSGDIAGCDSLNRDYATAELVKAAPNALVFTAGDNVYFSGSPEEYRDCYHPTWGAFKERTRPTLGNHEYNWPDKATSTAQGYFDYFNGPGSDSGVAGKRGKGYYALDHGAWRLLFLNSERNIAEQASWLARDLRNNSRLCQLAILHKPLFTSGTVGGGRLTRPLWDSLYAARVDVIVAAHQHSYERFAPMRLDGSLDEARGIREFVAGGGGGTLTGFNEAKPNSQERLAEWGVLWFRLYPDKYQWEYRDTLGLVRDSGESPCHGPPSTVPAPSSITLTVTGEIKSDGKTYSKLRWRGATGASVDVKRDGAWLRWTENDGLWTGSKLYTKPVTYTWQICEKGSAVCSNITKVSFP